MDTIQNVIEFKNYSLSIHNKILLNELSFNIPKNKITTIVGESGSGKSLTAHSIVGLLPKNIVTSGEIKFQNESLLKYKKEDWNKIRGSKIGMIFQEPQSSLNPTMTCGKQVLEVLKVHFKNLNKEQQNQKVIESLSAVQLENPKEIYNKYPFEISGGQKQRVMIAMALISEPDLLIADEPTTALDVLVQKQIIDLLLHIQRKTKVSILLISHDFSFVASLSDYIIVLKNGQIIEKGNANQIFNSPQEDYSKALIKAKPNPTIRLKKLPTVENINTLKLQEVKSIERKKYHQFIYSQKPILEIQNLSKSYFKSESLFSKKQEKVVLKSLSFKLYPGETLGIVGASGCGKSTLAKCLVFLLNDFKGAIYYNQKSVNWQSKPQFKEYKQNVQFVFQDPFAALYPKTTIGNAILEVMKIHTNEKNSQLKVKTLELLQQVGLTSSHFSKYPHELSGGQRQRVIIAKAIAVKPKVLICDESVASLDISVQAKILNLLNDLKIKLNLSLIFISHDLSVVKYMSDRVIVLNNGIIEEIGEADALYTNPKSSYTKKLIKAVL